MGRKGQKVPDQQNLRRHSEPGGRAPDGSLLVHIAWAPAPHIHDQSVSFPPKPVCVQWHIWGLEPHSRLKIKILQGPGCSWDDLPVTPAQAREATLLSHAPRAAARQTAAVICLSVTFSDGPSLFQLATPRVPLSTLPRGLLT